MASKRWRNSVLLAAIESTEGTAASISASTDGILVENPQPGFNEQNAQTAEVTGSLDPSEDVPIGGPFALSFTTYVKGNGTPGTAPEIGKLLKACGWTETVTAAAIPTLQSTVTGTNGSGGIGLAATQFGGADDAYNGMPVLLSGNPATSTFSLVKDFADTGNYMTVAETFSPPLDTTTFAQIPINVMYKPQSGTIPSLTFHLYLDGVKHIIVGARGTFKLSMEAGKLAKIDWSFTGILSSRAAVSNPSPTYPDITASKLVWRNDNTNGAFLVDGTRIGVTNFMFDNGNQLDSAPNPNQPQGFDVADIVSRTMVGSINPRLVDPSTRDFLDKKRNATKVAIAAFMRRSAGNSFGIIVPTAQLTTYANENQNGAIAETLSFKATGINEGARLAFW